jgi:hypothetical protein
MKKIIRLTESDLTRIVKRVIKESTVNLTVGSKISEITNRLYVMGRAYRFSDIMKDKRENEFEINDATVTKKTSNGYVIKVRYVHFDPKNDRKLGETGTYKTLNDVCLRIDNDDIIEYKGGILQLSWSNSFIEGRVTDCGDKKPVDPIQDTTVDYTDIFLEYEDVKKFQEWVANVKKDKAILGPRGIDSDWGPDTRKAWEKYGAEYVTTLKKPENKKCFTGMRYQKVSDYGYKKFPENFEKKVNGDSYIYYKGTDWTSGKGRLISGDGLGEKTFDWTCTDGKLTTTNMAKDWKRIMPF